MDRQQHPHSPQSPRLYKYLPALASLHGYQARNFRADLLAGITVATLAVPQAMAYAMVAGIPVQYGLYTAIVMTLIGALMASSHHIINGPTNAISIAVFSVIAFAATEEAKIEAAILLALMVGFIQIVISVLRLGDLTRYISHSVIIGFTLGAGTLIVLDQFKNVLGLKSQGEPDDHFLYRFYLTMTDGGDAHYLTLLVALITIALIVLLRHVKTRHRLIFFPDHLIAISLVTFGCFLLDAKGLGVKLIGDIPAALPTLTIPELDLETIRELAPGALAIAILGMLEALAIAKAIAGHTKQKLDTTQQCLSEGVANFVGGLFQCFPGSGSFTRSAVNHQAGAFSQWSGVIAALAVGAIMYFAAPLAAYIPRAALAGLLVVSVWRMVDWPTLRYHVQATRYDAAIVFVTAISAVAISIEFCVLIGILMSFILTVPRAAQMQRTEFVVTDEGRILERLPEDKPCCRLLMFGLEGELFFGAASTLEHHLDHIERRCDDQVRVVILRLKRLRNPDSVGLSVLADFIKRMKARGIHIIVCGVRSNLYTVMQRTGIDKLLDENEIFLEQPVRESSTMLAIQQARRLLGTPCPDCAHARDNGPALYYSV